MAFVTGEIARRPDIQAKIRQEIKRIAEESGETDWKHYRPSFDDYNKMKYIDNVVKESQRLWTILPAIARMAVESETIEGVNIPKGVCSENSEKILIHRIIFSSMYFPTIEMPSIFQIHGLLILKDGTTKRDIALFYPLEWELALVLEDDWQPLKLNCTCLI